VRGAIAELRTRGNQLAVLVPLSWQLTQALEVDSSLRRGGEVQPPPWVSEGEGRSAFVGAIDDVPVLDVVEMPDDRMVIVALDQFLRWLQWQLADGSNVAVELTAYDEEEARALVQEHEDWFREEERTTDAARARHVRKLILLDVYERFKVEVVDPDAALWMAVPDDLRGP
jgi:hypothetical protein